MLLKAYGPIIDIRLHQIADAQNMQTIGAYAMVKTTLVRRLNLKKNMYLPWSFNHFESYLYLARYYIKKSFQFRDNKPISVI